MIGHLSQLCHLGGVGGEERAVADWLLAAWSDWVDDAWVDDIGNYYGRRRKRPQARRGTPVAGTRPLVLAAAHLDAIGLMVAAITPGGFLRVVPVGGVDRRVLLGQEVVISANQGTLPGIIGFVPPHLAPKADRKDLPPFSGLFVDTGLSEAEVRARVPIGARVAIAPAFAELAGDRVAGRFLDNRASLAALAVALHELRRVRPLPVDFVAAGTVGEEFGGLGAATVAQSLRPAVVIAVDVTFGSHPGATDDAFALDAGPTVMVGPNAHPGLARRMREVAERVGIPVQVEVAAESSGTDAWVMEVQGAGAVAGVLSIPLRYMHTPVETVSLQDIRHTGRLLAQLVLSLDEGLVNAWTARS